MLKILSELFFPRRCVLCDTVLATGEEICEKCQKKIRYVEGPKCYQCGCSVASSETEYCDACKKKKHLYEKGFALYEYESVKDSLYRFKYHDRPAYGEFYAMDLARRIPALRNLRVDFIAAVPMYPGKKRKRGYNQAEVLAKELSKQLKIPYKKGLLKRVKNTNPMKELGPSERQINLQNAFIVPVNDVKLEGVLLVDDIYTTGATVDACTRVLKEAGVKKVYVVSLSIGTGV